MRTLIPISRFIPLDNDIVIAFDKSFVVTTVIFLKRIESNCNIDQKISVL